MLVLVWYALILHYKTVIDQAATWDRFENIVPFPSPSLICYYYRPVLKSVKQS